MDLCSAGPFVLHRLEELGLQDVHPDSQQLFSPSAFPALRVFSFFFQASHLYDIGPLLLGLEPQLDLLWIDGSFQLNGLGPDELDRINRKTLFDCPLRRIAEILPYVQFCRITNPSPNTRFPNTLQALEDIVRASSTPLPSVLYLAIKESVDPTLEGWRQSFWNMCRARNMEVVYEPVFDWNIDCGRPPEFYRRMRGGKGKRA